MDISITNAIGFLLPPLIDIVNRKIENDIWRFIISMVICVVVGVILNIGSIVPFDGEKLLSSIALIFTTAQITYTTYWKESGNRGRLMTFLQLPPN